MLGAGMSDAHAATRTHHRSSERIRPAAHLVVQQLLQRDTCVSARLDGALVRSLAHGVGQRAPLLVVVTLELRLSEREARVKGDARNTAAQQLGDAANGTAKVPSLREFTLGAPHKGASERQTEHDAAHARLPDELPGGAHRGQREVRLHAREVWIRERSANEPTPPAGWPNEREDDRVWSHRGEYAAQWRLHKCKFEVVVEQQ